MSETQQDTTWPSPPAHHAAHHQKPQVTPNPRGQLVWGVFCLIVGVCGMLLAIFLGWAVATGEAGRQMYHDAPLTVGGMLRLGVLVAFFLPPFGLIWGPVACLYGALKIRKSLPLRPTRPRI